MSNRIFDERIEELLNNNTFNYDSQVAKFYVEKYGYNRSFDSLRKRISDFRRKNNIPHLTRERVVSDTKIVDNKKFGEINWRDVANHLIERQELHSKSSFSQDSADIKFTTKLDKIILMNLADLHLGSIGSDYKLFMHFTELILNNDNIFVGLYGDLIDNFVAFRNQLAMQQQILSPDQQDEFLESWLMEVKNKILFSCWGTMRSFRKKPKAEILLKEY